PRGRQPFVDEHRPRPQTHPHVTGPLVGERSRPHGSSSSSEDDGTSASSSASDSDDRRRGRAGARRPASGIRPRQPSNVESVIQFKNTAIPMYAAIQRTAPRRRSSKVDPPAIRTPDSPAATDMKPAPRGGSPITIRKPT